jgi:hypothetical protein
MVAYRNIHGDCSFAAVSDFEVKMIVRSRISNGLALGTILLALAGSFVFGTNLANAMSGGFGNYQKPRGAPGPIAGAGLPILAVGYGAYWLIKRRRRKPD